MFNNGKRINTALQRLEELNGVINERLYAADPHEIVKAAEAKNAILLSRMVYVAALRREESRSWQDLERRDGAR